MNKMGEMFNLYFVIELVALKERFVNKGENYFSCSETLHNNLKLCFKRIFNIVKHDFVQKARCKTV